MTIDPNMSKIKKVAKLWNKGVSQAEIGRKYKISRQRVGQIISRQCKMYDIKTITFKKWLKLNQTAKLKNT